MGVLHLETFISDFTFVCISLSTAMQLRHFLKEECRSLNPPSAHAAGLSAEHKMRVPRSLMSSPSTINGVPESYYIYIGEYIFAYCWHTFSKCCIAFIKGSKISLIPYLLISTVLTTVKSCIHSACDLYFGSILPSM